MRLVGGSRFRTVIAIDIETEPEEAPDAAKPDLFRSQAGGATGGNAGHLGEFAPRAKFDIVGRRRLAHAVEPAGNAFWALPRRAECGNREFFRQRKEPRGRRVLRSRESWPTRAFSRHRGRQ